MERYFARKGNKTTAGGDVMEGDDSFIHDGRPIAFDGAKVYCPACNSTGVVRTIPPHHPFMVNGTQIALEGDLCACMCSTPPKLLASQSAVRMSFGASSGSLAPIGTRGFEEGTVARLASEQHVLDTAPVPDNVCYHQQYVLMDERTGAALVNAPYKIETEEGHVIEGRTDFLGRTQTVSSPNAVEATLHVYENHPPLNPDWDRHG